MAIIKDVGIVLRRLDYSETSQVLAVFCRETGQQRLIAKGVKRGTKTRFAVGIDLAELGHVMYSRRPGSEAQLGTLTDWRQEAIFDAARRDLRCWYAAQYAADRTIQATHENDPHPIAFDAIVDLLTRLDGPTALSGVVSFLLVLLREIGLIPQFERCAACGADGAAAPLTFFSARQGGVICRDCEPAMIEKRRVHPAAVAILVRNNAVAGAAAVRAAFDVLDYHLTESLAKPSRVTKALLAAVAASEPPAARA